MKIKSRSWFLDEFLGSHSVLNFWGFKSSLILKSVFGFGLGALSLGALSQTTKDIRVMSYNVQNLFDTRDDPQTRDEEFTPEGRQKWVNSVIEDKFQNLGRVVRSVSPDILAVQEIENQSILEQWVQKGLRDEKYTSVITGPTDDMRGIRPGLITRFPVLSVRSHKVWSEALKDSKGAVMKTRDILEVELKVAPQQNLVVFVNHWPSKGGGVDADRLRGHVSRELVKLVNQKVVENPDRLVLALGDFNDELGSSVFRSDFPLVDSFDAIPKRSKMGLVSLAQEERTDDPSRFGTFYFHPESKWNLIDHFFVGLRPEYFQSKKSRLIYKSGSYSRVLPPEEFLGEKQNPQGCEIIPERNIFQGREGARCPRGASDHFAIKADLTWSE